MELTSAIESWIRFAFACSSLEGAVVIFQNIKVAKMSINPMMWLRSIKLLVKFAQMYDLELKQLLNYRLNGCKYGCKGG